ncbi:MAG TPA: hypothetical protein DCE41_17190 [Cytophagales bacterium]|nr:hypothetical protein [Cytophagales bacterium]HAA18212.1 hypothetical protein [Cytophagales bacterium]HAP59228.1 hypothetical protein [Cytophagales bacterium]
MQSLKKIVLVVLAVANLGTSLMTPLVYLDFELRQDYIATVLCVEREKPITMCMGSCFLTDRLKALYDQQEERDEVMPPSEVQMAMPPAYKMPRNQPRLQMLLQDETPQSDLAQYKSVVTDIFHPPQVVG